jgi:hypothetical protein
MDVLCRVEGSMARKRWDVMVQNDATGFLIASLALRGREIDVDQPAWKKAVAAGELWPVELVQDDGFVIRVVVDAPLSAAEADEWVGRLAWKLCLPDGQLMISGGIESVLEPAGEELSDYTRVLEVPPGEYRAELLAYVHGVNGSTLLERADQRVARRPGAWFRKTRGDAKFPPWLRFWCRADPTADPGHEEEWARPPRKPEPEIDQVDFLLHLSPLVGAPPSRPRLEQGFFSFGAFEARVPAKCPLGLLARDVIGRDDDEDADELPAAVSPEDTADVLGRIGKRQAVKIKGGPVELPVERIAHAFELAWLACPSTEPELRIVLPKKARFAPWRPGEATTVTREGDTLRVGFAQTPGWMSAIRAVAALGGPLARLPDGSTLELLCAPDPEIQEADPDAGVQRYRGVVKAGVWAIGDSFPAVAAATLREGLAFAAAVEEGAPLALRDEAEAERVTEILRRDASLFDDNPLVVKGLRIGARKKDAMIAHTIGAAIFRTRWSDVWPCEVADDAVDDELADLMAELSKKAAATAQKLAPRGGRALILAGEVGKFEKAELRRERPLDENTVVETDRQLKKLGYQVLGDLVCSRFPEVLVRGYARAGGDTWGALICGMLESTFDFVSELGDAGLTTTLNAGFEHDEPRKRIYRSRHPELNFFLLADLHARHDKRKATLAKKLGAPRPTEPTLRALAEAIDRGLRRELAGSSS